MLACRPSLKMTAKTPRTRRMEYAPISDEEERIARAIVDAAKAVNEVAA